jgi:hypothetical protein
MVERIGQRRARVALENQEINPPRHFAQADLILNDEPIAIRLPKILC